MIGPGCNGGGFVQSSRQLATVLPDARRMIGRLLKLLSLALAIWIVLAQPGYALSPSQVLGVRLGERAGKDAAASRIVIDLSAPTEILLRAAPDGRTFDILLL